MNRNKKERQHGDNDHVAHGNLLFVTEVRHGGQDKIEKTSFLVQDGETSKYEEIVRFSVPRPKYTEKPALKTSRKEMKVQEAKKDDLRI